MPRKRKAMKGAGVISAAKKIYAKVKAVHDKVKQGQYISRGLQYVGDGLGHEGAKKYAAIARQKGYGQGGGCKCQGGGRKSSKMIF